MYINRPFLFFSFESSLFTSLAHRQACLWFGLIFAILYVFWAIVGSLSEVLLADFLLF